MNRYLAMLGLGLLLLGSGCCATRCCSYGKTCSPEIKATEVKHNCYCDTCKDICIPAVRFPWEDCCAPLRCGYVRSVKQLTKWEYKCASKEVKWNVVNSGCYNGNCNGHCNGACGSQACGSDANAAPSAPQPLPASAINESLSPSDVPPMPPVVIQQTNFFGPGFSSP